MSSTVFFAFLVADISAFMIPGTSIDLPDEHFISNSLAKGIEAASQSIKDAGLDPLHISEKHASMALPVAVLFHCGFRVENISSTGMSDIVTHKISYSLFTSRFNFDIELPFIDFSIGAASFEAMLFSKSYDVKASGKVEIQSVRIAGELFVKFDIFSGISIRRININFTLGNIIAEINELLEIVLKDFIDAKLP